MELKFVTVVKSTMATTLLTKGGYSWADNLLRIGAVHIGAIRTTSSCCTTHTITISKAHILRSSPIIKNQVLSRYKLLSKMHILTACHSGFSSTKSFRRNSSKYTTEIGENKTETNSDHGVGTESRRTDSVPTSSNDTENCSEADGQRFMNQQKQVFKNMLDDAQTQKTVRDEFDFSDIPQQKKKITDTVSGEMKIDPAETSVLLFPGQGAQFVGMGQMLLDYPVVKDMYAAASEILGYDLLALCISGPKEDLDRTIHCQPAVLVTSLAAVEKLKQENSKAIENCVAAAGFSVGEYAALVFGGVLSFEDAVYLIKIRAEAMQRASDMVPSGMISVIGNRGATYKEMCAEAANYCKVSHKMENPVCRVSSYLFPHARVLAGHKEALEFIIDMKRQFRLRTIKHIPVSGAFHTPLMAPAEESIANALEEINLDEPLISIHSNVDSKRYCHTKHIRKQLRRQVVEPVMWEQTMCEIYQRKKNDKHPLTYEVGPGHQLGSMLSRYNLKAFKSYYKVDV